MAEMTASEAKDLLTAKADIPQDIKDSPFFNLYLRISVENARRIAALIEQQAQEIERLQIREHRMIEYMRDVKNFAFTINEVANNAIEEAEVQE